MPAPVPTILVFDSGLGGLTVFAEVLKARPDARFVYAADDAGFPYGRLTEEALVGAGPAVMDRLIARHAPDLVVIACNTASTLVLPHLRERFAVPFVGTVPAIKPAAQVSLTERITVLATPGTVARDYTRDLIETYAAGCRVNLVGSRRLAGFAEAELAGAPVADADIARGDRALLRRGRAARAPTWSRSPARIIRCSSRACARSRPGRSPGSTRRRRSPGGSCSSSAPPIPGHEADEEEAMAVFTDGAGRERQPCANASARDGGLPLVAVEPMPLGLPRLIDFPAQIP